MKDLLLSHPEAPQNAEYLTKVATECGHCAAACLVCADACLAEPEVSELRACISLDQSCADICWTTCRLLTRVMDVGLDLSESILALCAQICNACAEECERHADMHDHCRMCAEACRRCEEACLVNAQPVYLMETSQ